MNKIKFSHHYYKLDEQGTTAKLIGVIPYHIDSTTPQSLLEYDTAYPGGHYALKDGDYVILLFLGNKGLFTTIRTHYGKGYDKLSYYSQKVGEEFEIVINKEATPTIKQNGYLEIVDEQDIEEKKKERAKEARIRKLSKLIGIEY